MTAAELYAELTRVVAEGRGDLEVLVTDPRDENGRVCLPVLRCEAEVPDFMEVRERGILRCLSGEGVFLR